MSDEPDLLESIRRRFRAPAIADTWARGGASLVSRHNSARPSVAPAGFDAIGSAEARPERVMPGAAMQGELDGTPHV